MPERNLREMRHPDISAVLAVIDSHDEDDANEADGSFARYGHEHFRVLEIDGNIAGITGVRPIDGADGSGWLSWTYVHEDYCGHGHGRWMLETLINEMRDRGVRKLFVAISDYVDPEDGPIYAAALKLYQSVGFRTEVRNADFYAIGENQQLMGLRLAPVPTTAPNIEDESPPIKFVELDEIAETSGSWFIGWEVSGKTLFEAEDLQVGLDAAKEQGARAVYITFPSNLPDVRLPLLKAGFKAIGQLDDYFEDGCHEMHFVYLIKGN